MVKNKDFAVQYAMDLLKIIYANPANSVVPSHATAENALKFLEAMVTGLTAETR